MALDIQRLTLGEVAKIEELSGQSIASIGEEDKPKGLALAALAFVTKRREDPAFKWNDALELTFTQASDIVGLSEDEEGSDPLDETAEPPASLASSSAKTPTPAKPRTRKK